MRGIEALRQFLDPVEKEINAVVKNGNIAELVRLYQQHRNKHLHNYMFYTDKKYLCGSAKIISAGAKLSEQHRGHIDPFDSFRFSFDLLCAFLEEFPDSIEKAREVGMDQAHDIVSTTENFLAKIKTGILIDKKNPPRQIIRNETEQLKNIHPLPSICRSAKDLILSQLEEIEAILLLKHGVFYEGKSADEYHDPKQGSIFSQGKYIKTDPLENRNVKLPDFLKPKVKSMPLMSPDYPRSLWSKIGNLLQLADKEDRFPAAYSLEAYRIAQYQLQRATDALGYLDKGSEQQLDKNFIGLNLWGIDYLKAGLEIVIDCLIATTDFHYKVPNLMKTVESIISSMRTMVCDLRKNPNFHYFLADDQVLNKLIAADILIRNIPLFDQYSDSGRIINYLETSEELLSSVDLTQIEQKRKELAQKLGVPYLPPPVIIATIAPPRNLPPMPASRTALAVPPASPEVKFKPGQVIESTDHKKWGVQEVRQGAQAFVLIVKNPDIDRTEVLRIYQDAGNGQKAFESANLLIKMRQGLPQSLRSHLPEIYGTLEDAKGNRFLRMEYVNGETTAELMEKQIDHRLTQNQVIQILKLAVPVLEFLHSKHKDGPFVLRDIKPSNIMLNHDLKGSIVDLYFPDWDVTIKAGKYTDNNLAYGTEVYAAQEQIFVEQKGYFEIWPITDIYALGITINQWLTGIEPQGKNYDGNFDQRFPELVAMVQKGELEKEWLKLIEGCTRTNTPFQNPSLPCRWSVRDIENWLVYFRQLKWL